MFLGIHVLNGHIAIFLKSKHYLESQEKYICKIFIVIYYLNFIYSVLAD